MACVLEFFYSVNLQGEKKTQLLSLTPALRHVNGVVVCVCNIFTSTADPGPTRCFLTADYTCLCTYVTKEDQRSRLMRRFDIFLLHSAPCHIYAPFLKDSALCSCF